MLFVLWRLQISSGTAQQSFQHLSLTSETWAQSLIGCRSLREYCSYRKTQDCRVRLEIGSSNRADFVPRVGSYRVNALVPCLTGSRMANSPLTACQPAGPSRLSCATRRVGLASLIRLGF